jgi:hypothetical protein
MLQLVVPEKLILVTCVVTVLIDAVALGRVPHTPPETETVGAV